MSDERPSGSGTQPPLILLVDDYEDSRTMYAGFLSSSGYRVAEAEDGFESVDQARALIPDLVLMDVSLPGIDGWEACRRLKADPGTKHIPVLMLTAHNLMPDQIDGGCDGVITKPCSPEQLLIEIGRFLNASQDQAGRVDLQL